MQTDAEIDAMAQIVWDYHLLRQPLARCECLLVLGSNDPRVAEHGARLFLDGWAPRVVFSGGVGALTEGMYAASEAEHFAGIARQMGVPDEQILVEPHSTNTGENIRFTRALLEREGLSPRSFLVVQKPFMERRTYATFCKQWPGPQIVVSSPPVAFRDYPNERLSRRDIINVMVGDLQRIREYPARGFQIPQEIPDTVWSAWEQLVAAGFDRHLI
jgi:uncharacterized SAM-binding protein YcdF (DUF218 family)